MASLSKDNDDSGYPCRFVEPPKEIQTECPVCLCILHDPYIVSCCGLKFCYVCIRAIQTSTRSCPHCQSNAFSTMADKQLKRQLGERKVYCTNEGEGCKWTGCLSTLLDHLGNSRLTTACLYENVECTRCRVKVKRQALGLHERTSCPHRLVPCLYEHAGCKVKVRKSAMKAHLEANMVEHTEFSVNHSKECSAQLTSASLRIDTLANDVMVLEQKLNQTKDNLNIGLGNSHTQLKAVQDAVHQNSNDVRNAKHVSAVVSLLFLVTGTLFQNKQFLLCGILMLGGFVGVWLRNHM